MASVSNTQLKLDQLEKDCKEQEEWTDECKTFFYELLKSGVFDKFYSKDQKNMDDIFNYIKNKYTPKEMQNEALHQDFIKDVQNAIQDTRNSDTPPKGDNSNNDNKNRTLYIILTIIAIILIGGGIYWYMNRKKILIKNLSSF
jgi:hypothetical protein